MHAIKEITYADIIKLINGSDENGAPYSSACLAVDKIISDDETQTLSNVILKSAEINAYTEGGCCVIEAIFPPNATFERRKAYEICMEWLNQNDNENLNENDDSYNVLSLLVSPLRLCGNLHMLFSNLVYCTDITLEDKRHKLIMCFDNLVTEVYQTEDIDYEALILQVEQELQYQEDETNRRIQEMKDETKQIEEEQNLYAQHIKKQYENFEIEKENDEETENKGMRFTDN